MAGTRGAYVLETDCTDHHDQVRLQVCTLARLDSAQTETTAFLQQVLTMLQRSSVRQRSRTLSMHWEVEPADFNSQTTKVGHHPRLWIHTNRYHSQVVANTATSIVTFSILSPDASLSYDRIKLRLEEYRTLLASDSDTIELSTENGKTVICRKQAKEIDEYLDQAEILLQDVLQSRDISTLVVLHHLRDLAEVLDNLTLYDECRLTGNCAIDLAEALGRRSLEFRQEQAETLAIIAGLSVYELRARTHKQRSEEHTSELQSLTNLVCRLLLEKKNTNISHPGVGIEEYPSRSVVPRRHAPEPASLIGPEQPVTYVSTAPRY